MARDEIIRKSPAEVESMTEGGAKLRRVKARLKEEVKIGKNAQDIDILAERLIKEEGGEPSFKMVPDYKWTVCVNINEGVVHGIPRRDIVFQSGDVVSVDVGMFYKGFHTDTSFTVGLEVSQDLEKFLAKGEEALRHAITKARVGGRIFDISEAIETTLVAAHLTPIRALVGHGVGRVLHEDPQIPCFVSGKRENSPEIPEGAVLAIEVMYTQGGPEVLIDRDGWTIVTSDGTISALFEDTIAVGKNGPKVLT